MSAKPNSAYMPVNRTASEDSQIVDTKASRARSSASTTTYLVYIVFIATLGPFQFGYHLGELNAPEKVITCKVHRIPQSANSPVSHLPQCIPMSEAEWGFVQSAFTVGGLIGALVAGPVATQHGRLLSMKLLTLSLIIGPAVQALAASVGLMGFGRFISGIGAGAATVVCPIFVAEVTPVPQRGLFGAFTQVMINLGILTSQVIGYFLSRGQLWRIILATAGGISLISLVGLFFAPETPKWLAENGQTALAKSLLKRIRGQDADIWEEVSEWEDGNDEQRPLLFQQHGPGPRRASGASFVDAMRVAKYRRAVYALVAVFAAQQLTGINSVVMYSVSVLGSILPGSAALITVMVSSVNVLVTLFCAPLADRIGRKKCLLISIGGMGINSVLLVFGLSNDIAPVTVTALVLFVCSFAVGLGPVPYILASELVGPEAVGAASSWALATNWIATFCVAQFFPIVNAAVPRGFVYLVFAAAALILGSFIAWWVPESKGKATAEEVWRVS